MWLLKIVQSIAKSVWKMDDLIMGKIHWPPTNHQTHALTDRQTDPAHTIYIKTIYCFQNFNQSKCFMFPKILKIPGLGCGEENQGGDSPKAIIYQGLLPQNEVSI